MTKPFAVTDASFEQDVLESDQLILVDFWADWCQPCKMIAPIVDDWCQPCKMIAPIVDELAEEYDDVLKVGKLDADENLNTMMAYGVMGIPTLILFKGGEAVERITGYMPKDKLVARLQPHLESARN